jgi:hypothetical protein
MTKELQTIRTIIDNLHAEADRFTAKAKDLALSVLQNPDQPDKVRLAREHLIRAETYKDAARLVAP